jgi:hypothetical protein
MAIPVALFKADVIPRAPARLVMSWFPCNRIDRQAIQRESAPMIEHQIDIPTGDGHIFITHPERNLA